MRLASTLHIESREYASCFGWMVSRRFTGFLVGRSQPTCALEDMALRVRALQRRIPTITTQRLHFATHLRCSVLCFPCCFMCVCVCDCVCVCGIYTHTGFIFIVHEGTGPRNASAVHNGQRESILSYYLTSIKHGH
jgi:hypothetical protein